MVTDPAKSDLICKNYKQILPIVKLQSSLTGQSKSVGLEVDFVSPQSQEQEAEQKEQDPLSKSTRRK